MRVYSIREELRAEMCGRYYIDENAMKELERVLKKIDRHNLNFGEGRDIHPGDQAPILCSGANGPELSLMQWGFPGFDGTKVIFNARSETAPQKTMFRDSILERRCVVPAAKFYEWDRDKNKAAFFKENRPLLLLAGFYKTYGGANRFVILTTQANASVIEVHERMPLTLELEELHAWVGDKDDWNEILQKRPGPLKADRDYFQERLWFP